MCINLTQREPFQSCQGLQQEWIGRVVKQHLYPSHFHSAVAGLGAAVGC